MKTNLLMGTVVIGCCLLSSSRMAQSQTLQESMTRGKDIYLNECITCHMENGEGIPGAFPPLAKSDYMKNNLAGTVDAILNGLSGEVVVNGVTYYGEMAPIALTDQEVADVINYVQNSWGNEAKMLKANDIAKLKKKE